MPHIYSKSVLKDQNKCVIMNLIYKAFVTFQREWSDFMGRIDSETKEYMKRPEVFADLFNHLIYDGQNVIKPSDLSELDTTATFIPFDETGKAFPVQKYRDVLKSAVVMEDADAVYALILGIENQTDIHYAMPVRNMGYDAYNYAAQVAAIARNNRKNPDSETDFLSGLQKDDKITPVITLVVYFGAKPWDGPMSIHEMFSTKKNAYWDLYRTIG